MVALLVCQWERADRRPAEPSAAVGAGKNSNKACG